MGNRIDPGTTIGGGMLGGGVVGEVSKPVEPLNMMDFDVFFGIFSPQALTLTGFLAISGAMIMFLSFVRNRQIQNRKEEREEELHRLKIKDSKRLK